jgi:Gamma-aminobutyrate permease and related permeases
VLPRATLVAVLLIAVLYTSMAFVLPVIVQPAYTGDNALLWFAATLSAPHWTFIALFLLILALLTSFNAGLRGASRMVYMLGREGRISQRMTRLGADGLTPVNAVTAVGLLALLSGVATIALDLTRMLSELSAALICAVYAALLIASSRNAQRKQFVTDFFNSSVPLTARWLLASLFAVLSGVSAIQLMRDTTGFVLVAMMIVGLILLTQLTAARGQLHPVMNNQSN